MVILDPSLVLSPYLERILDDIDSSSFVFSEMLCSALANQTEALEEIAKAFETLDSVRIALSAFGRHEDWYRRYGKPTPGSNEVAFRDALLTRLGDQLGEYAARVMAETVVLAVAHSGMILALDAVSSLTWGRLAHVVGSEAVTSICLYFGHPGPFASLPMSLETMVPFRPRLIEVAVPPLYMLGSMYSQELLRSCRINAFTIKYDSVSNAE